MASTDARPIPKKNVAYRVTFPILDADGDLVTGAASLDSEVSKDGGTFADCTNEATEIATNSGIYYLDLTSTEMDADTVAIIVKTGTAGAKTTPIVLYPEEAGDIRVDVTQISGDSAAADNLESYTDGTTPIPANVTQISGDAGAADNLEAATDGTGYNVGNGSVVAASVTGNVGGNVIGSVGSVAAGGITAASIATDAIDNDAIAASAVTEIQSGLATAASIAALNNLSAAQVNAEVDTALADVGLTPTVTGRIDQPVSSRLAPTVAGRTLDVSAGGEAGLDWANVGSPATTLNLSGTTIKTATDVEADTQDIQGRLPAVLTPDGLMYSDVWAWRGDGNIPINMSLLPSLVASGEISESAQQETFMTNLLTLGGDYKDWLFYSPANSTIHRVVLYAAGEFTIDPPLGLPSNIGDPFYVIPHFLAVNTVAISNSEIAADNVEANIGNLDAAVSSRSTLTAAQVWASATRTLTSFGTLASDAATAVWASGTRTLTSFGTLVADVWAYVTRTLTSGGGGATPAQIWDYLTSSIATSGSIGKYILDRLAILVSGVEITVTSPLAPDGETMTIVQGDDYYAADGRSFEWSSDGWPDLTGATVVWTATRPAVPADTFTVNMTVEAAGVGTQTVRLELPKATTKEMTADGEESYKFDVQATLVSSHIVTLVSPESAINVQADITDN